MAINNKTMKLCLSIMFVIAIIILRRPDQIFNPVIWAEDASFIFMDYVKHGFNSIFIPVQGYLITSSKLINFIALKTSFYYYPEIASYLAIAVMISISIAIWLSPTVLHYKWLCSILIFLQPFNPETFSVALFSFWWLGLLLILSLLWKDNLIWLKNIYVVIAGLSSPLIVGFSPIFLLRYYFSKKESDLVTFFIASLISVIQIYFIVTTGASKTEISSVLDIVYAFDVVIVKFFGFYLFKVEGGISLTFGLLLVSYITYSLFRLKRKKDIYILFLILLCVVFMSIYRMPLNAIDPIDAGPRYFFYPYIVITWLLLYIAGEIGNRFKLFGILFILISLINTIVNNGFIRKHDIIDWRGNINKCTMFDNYYLPFHSDGNSSHSRLIELSRTDCIKLYESSLIFDTLPIRVDNIIYRFSPLNNDEQLEIVDEYWFSDPEYWKYGAIYSSDSLSLDQDFLVIGSFINGDKFKGKQNIFQSKNDHVKLVYTTGPSTSGQYVEVLSMVNSEPMLLRKIPLQPSTNKWSIVEIAIYGNYGSLMYRIVDDSSDWGEWSAYVSK